MQTYIIRKTNLPERLNGDWNSAGWQIADTLDIASFRPESGVHRPRAQARLLYDDQGIHGIFFVQDRYVRCVRTKYMDEVWKDSCVELFVQPKADKGYFNFEFNCGGAFLCCYITNPERTSNGFKEFTRVPFEVAKCITTSASLPRVIDPEIETPVHWTLKYFIPFALLEEYVGDIGDATNRPWRGNLFKCVEENSHPHWASWSPVDDFNFHLPRCFGTLRFAP
jgi:hypothetical protein